MTDESLSAVTAAVLSARFPGITPAASIQCSDTKRRLVDGGYFENSGLTTAMDVVRSIAPAAKDNNLSLHVVTIENSEISSPTEDASYFSELLSPFRTMDGTRTAHADLARKYFQQMLATQPQDCGKQSCLDWIRYRLQPCGKSVPLGWSLSEASINEIKKQLIGVDPKCSNLKSYKDIAALIHIKP